MKDLKLKQIRIQASFFSTPDRDRTRHLGEAIAYKYLSCIETIRLPNTNIVIIDFNNHYNDSSFYEVIYGEKMTGFITTIRGYFNDEYFIGCSEREKHIYILERIHFLIKKIFNENKMDIYPLERGYQKICEMGFWITVKESSKIPKTSKEFALEYLVKFRATQYRLALRDISQNTIEYVNICEKSDMVEDQIDMRKIGVEEWLKIPRFLNEDGFLNDIEFQFSWGKEKYIFNIETKQIRIVMEQ